MGRMDVWWQARSTYRSLTMVFDVIFSLKPCIAAPFPWTARQRTWRWFRMRRIHCARVVCVPTRNAAKALIFCCFPLFRHFPCVSLILLSLLPFHSKSQGQCSPKLEEMLDRPILLPEVYACGAEGKYMFRPVSTHWFYHLFGLNSTTTSKSDISHVSLGLDGRIPACATDVIQKSCFFLNITKPL